MSTSDPHRSDDAIRALIDANNLQQAMARLVEREGSGLFGMVRGHFNDPVRAEEVFQDALVAIFTSLTSFRWESSLRSWSFAVARNVIRNAIRSAPHRRERRLNTDEAMRLSAHHARTVTDAWLRTDAKLWLWEALDQFDHPDRSLILLRLNEKMTWIDIARILKDDETTEDARPEAPAVLKKRAAALRKRYQRLKDRLRELHISQKDA